MRSIKNSNIRLIAVATVISIIFLLVFWWLQYLDSSLLDLDTQWIVVAALPILIALFLGGYISKFKGFGFELEANLSQPLSEDDIKIKPILAASALEEIEPMDKGGVSDVIKLSDKRKEEIQSIRFIAGSSVYYSESAVDIYLSELVNLRYIVVEDSNRRFYCLLRKSVVIENGIGNLISELSSGDVRDFYGNDAVATTIERNDPLTSVITKFRKTAQLELPAVDNDKFIGIVRKEHVFNLMADAIIQAEGRV